MPHLVDVKSPPSLERRPHVNENSQSRPQRRERTRFNHIQSVELEREFHKNPYPGIQRRVELASKLAIDESRIQVRAILMQIFMGLISYLFGFMHSMNEAEMISAGELLCKTFYSAEDVLKNSDVNLRETKHYFKEDNWAS